MKESYNIRFFQFFLVLALTIIVSETVLTHVSYQAYARENDSEVLVISEDSQEPQLVVESALGKARTYSVTPALKAEAEGFASLETPTRPEQSLSHTDVQEAAQKAQEALEETKTEELSATKAIKKYPGEDISSESTDTTKTPEAEPTEETEAEPAYTEPEPTYEPEPVEEESVPEADVPAEDPEVPEEVPEEEPSEESQIPEPTPEEEPQAEEVPEEESEPETSSESDNYTYLGEFKLTAYCPCAQCCGQETGITASGTVATEGRTIAVDPNVIPYGTTVYIDGYGTFIAEDTGGFASSTIDIFFNSHSAALQFGVQYASVYIVG